MPVREQPVETKAAPADAREQAHGPARSDANVWQRPRARREVIDDPPIPPPTAIRGLYRRIGTTTALAGAALIGGLMWYYGGVCSLDYLGDTFTVIATFIGRTTWWQHW